MSSTNPRRAVIRPNGAASHQQQPHHHQQQHSYPSKASTPQPYASKESDEVRALRAKFGSKLDTLKEMFSTWSDEDLLNVLNESSGSVETAVTRIAEGHAEQWGAVSRKKDKKGTTHSGAGSPHQQQQHFAARDRTESGGAASPGRSGFRGRGGGRGGRGGGNVGRGGGRGHHGVNGHGSSSPLPSGAVDAPTSPVDAAPEGLPITGGHAIDYAGVAKKQSDLPNGVQDHPAAQPPPPEQDAKPVEKQAAPKTNGTASLPAKPVVKASPVPTKMSWAQIAKPKPKPATPPAQAAPALATTAPAPLPVPEPTPVEEPAGVQPEEPASSTDGAWEDVKPDAPAAPEEPTEAPSSAWPEPATTAPGDDWIAVTPPKKPVVELPAAPAVTSTEPPSTTPSKTWTEIAAPPAPVCSATPVDDLPTTVVDQPEAPTTTAQPPTIIAESIPAPPPGLPSLPVVSTPSLGAPAAIPRSSTPSTKPATPRLSSHRASARFRSDAPVVLPAGIGAVGSGLGSLSFGSAVVGTGFEAAPRGMQFGSLSLNDDLDSAPPAEAPAPESAKEEEPAPAPVPVAAPVPVPVPAPAPAPVIPVEPISKPERSPAPVAAPIPEPRVPTPPQPQTLSQTSSTLSASNLGGMGLYQQQANSQLQTLPQQVTVAQSAIPSQVQTSTVSNSLPFTSHQGPAPGLQLPQQQNHQPQGISPSHQTQQHVSPAQSTNNIHTPSQHQPQTQTQTSQQQSQPQHLPYSTNHQLPPHLDANVTSQQPTHPSVAAQNQYFRQESSYFHTPTPPQSIIPQHQLSQTQDQSLAHSSPYGAFSPLAQTQASHLTGFGGSPAPGDYASYGDSQRAFYDAYGQASTFPNRTQLGHEDTTKTGLPGSAPTTAPLGQQPSALGQGQPALAATQQAQQQQQFPGMMPYYYSQPYYMPNQYYPQSNPYPPQPPYLKYPSYQPPHGPGAPPLQQQGGKPPASTNTPYSLQQAHSYHPGQTAGYEDPTSVGYQQTSNPTTDYGKQAPLYGQGMQNFFGAQTPVQSAGAPQLGGTTQQRGATGASTSPENPYKTYTGPAGVNDKQGQQQTTQGRSTVPGGPQPQGNYYNSRYSTASQLPQGHPQSDGQFYPSYQHQQPRQGYWQ